jgi:hypothetical protein
MFFVRIVLWTVAAMSGITSIIREWVSVFAPGTIKASTLYGASLLTSFVCSCGAALIWEHRRVSTLEDRLAPKLEIRRLVRREWPTARDPIGVEYYFEVFNSSEGTMLDGVEVRLCEMKPEEIAFLPVHLHLKHDNEVPHQTRFSINPKTPVHIDLITGPIPGTKQPMVVAHTVVAVREPISTRKYRLTVVASATSVLPVKAIFETWVDDMGDLKCIQL